MTRISTSSPPIPAAVSDLPGGRQVVGCRGARTVRRSAPRRLPRAVAFVSLIAASLAAVAHPGHVHQDGAVHGVSWIELMWLLLVPVTAAGLARWRRRGGGDKDQDAR